MAEVFVAESCSLRYVRFSVITHSIIFCVTLSKAILNTGNSVPVLHLNDEIPVQLSVEHLLQSFFKIERIDDVECSFCKQKLGLAENPKRAFLKTINIAKVLSPQSCVCNVRYCVTNYRCIFSACSCPVLSVP